MSGACSRHLQRRNGIYHLRMRVPDAVRQIVGLSVVRKSLRTYDHRMARRLAATIAARIGEAFAMILENQLNKEQGLEVIRSCFNDLIREAEEFPPFVAQSYEAQRETQEQKSLGQEYIRELEEQSRSHVYSGLPLAVANRRLAHHGILISSQPQTLQIDLLNGMVRALIEQQRLILHRLDDRLAPYNPIDPLFTHPTIATSTPQYEWDAPSPLMPDIHKGPTMGACVDDYLGKHLKRWQPRTHQARVWQLGYLVEFLGADKPISSVSSTDIRTYRDGILCLRANRGRSQSQSFRQKQTENTECRISSKSAAIIFEPCKAFFRWCKSVEGLIERNPAEDVRIVLDVQQKGKKSRRPFTANELTVLFSCPVFTGQKSPYSRLQPGPIITKDARYWIPVLGFYTGLRLGELVQLHLADIDVDGPIPTLSVNEDRPQGGDRKHVKSKAGVRVVPLHPEVMLLGFGDHVRKWKKLRKGSHRLFNEIAFGAHGQASGEFSKLFARQLDLIGLDDPTLCFHSFRHNAEDAFRDALLPKYVIDKIIGHDDGSTANIYGEGVALDVACPPSAPMAQI